VSSWQALWDEWGSTYATRVTSHDVQNEHQLRQELLFCLLGGHGITAELAASATERLWSLGILSPGRSPDADLEPAVAAELATPQFEPVKKNGDFRRYRYPQKKAIVITHATEWVQTHASDELMNSLVSIRRPQDRRAFLCECPGVGPKTASWLLRNIGLGAGLAILDIHVLRALRGAGRISAWRLPQDYERIERVFIEWCDDLGADPGTFDLLVWEWQRRTPRLH
jgi:N-glycosylase/DNA lyase